MREGWKRPALVVVLATVVVVGLEVYRSYFAPTPVERIERLLRRACAAAEARSILKLSDVFAIDYRDASGADRATILAQAHQFFMETQDDLSVKLARVMHENPDLPETATEATAIVVLQVSGTEKDGQKFAGVADQGADAFRVRFKKENANWVVSATKRLQATTPEAMLRELGQGS